MQNGPKLLLRVYIVRQMLPGQYDCQLPAGDPEQDKVRLS